MKKLTLNRFLLGLFLFLLSYAHAANSSAPFLCNVPQLPEKPQFISDKEQDNGGGEDGTGIDSGGEISADETICDNGIPAGIKNTASPSGDIEGFLIIKWEKRTLSGSWTIIPGATALTYFPEYIDQTTQYRRGCRESVSQPWKYSNTITKTIVNGIEDVRISTLDVACKGRESGKAVALVTGGTPTYTYEWSASGGVANAITGLAAGTYSVTVKDANGCTFVSENFTIFEPALSVQVSNLAPLNPMCHGEPSGFIFAEANFGVPPYFFEWSNGNVGNVNADLAAGTYNVTVRDAIGCTHTINDIVLTEPAPIELNQAITSTTCSETADGVASFSAFGGTAPYSYFWPDGYTGNSRSNLAAGEYPIAIIDRYGCYQNQTVIIDAPEPIQSGAITVNNKICKASINLVPNGGTAPYTYEWEDGSTAGFKGELCPGYYVINITDANGCEKSETVEISANYLNQNIIIETAFDATKLQANLTITLPYDKPTDIEIYTATGQLVRSFKNQFADSDKAIRLSVEMSDLSSGLYLINVQSVGLVATQKMVVSH